MTDLVDDGVLRHTPKPYRAYKREGCNYDTFFQRLDNGDYQCTHGGWIGTPVGDASLDTAHGVIDYDSFIDLEAHEYQEQFYGT